MDFILMLALDLGILQQSRIDHINMLFEFKLKANVIEIYRLQAMQTHFRFEPVQTHKKLTLGIHANQCTTRKEIPCTNEYRRLYCSIINQKKELLNEALMPTSFLQRFL